MRGGVKASAFAALQQPLGTSDVYQHMRRAYPEDVAALVFTNSSGRVGLITKSGGDLLWKL